jgi:hypothetical protein
VNAIPLRRTDVKSTFDVGFVVDWGVEMVAFAKLKPVGVRKLNVFVNAHVVAPAEHVTASLPKIPLEPVMKMVSTAWAGDATAAAATTTIDINLFIRFMITSFDSSQLAFPSGELADC